MTVVCLYVCICIRIYPIWVQTYTRMGLWREVGGGRIQGRNLSLFFLLFHSSPVGALWVSQIKQLND
jgi:hypothetical protein